MYKIKFRRREGQEKGHKSSQRGFVLVVAVLLMAGLIFVAGTSSLRSTNQTQVTAVELDNTKTFYAAEAGAEWGASELRTLLLNNMDPTDADLNSLTPPSIDGYTYDAFNVSKVGALTQEIITQGDYTGLTGYIQHYEIQSRASSERRSAEIAQEIQHQYIPLFQFGVFYDKDLEIYPGPNMTFAGRIHTNANLYMGAETGINCQSYVTAVGRYYHNRKDDPSVDPPGYVRVKDASGLDQDVWRSSYWLDERRPTWCSDALSLWGGMFRDQAHGLATLRLPLPQLADQHMIVERGVGGDDSRARDAKYWYKASERWVDGGLTDANGVALNQPNVFTYTRNKFLDARQNKWIDVVDIDINRMIAGNFRPPNGILYISNTGAEDAYAIRIINASTLPAGGLTIATDLPMYIKGSYNTVNKKGSALLSDALTLLSPSWDDARSNQSLNNRVPTAQNVNACFLTGHVGTAGSNYSGGLENLFRFLEKWDGIQVTFRGSIIDLWYSQRQTAPWSYGVYYTAPGRNWGFDTDLLQPSNWPPGTPRVHTIQRGTWRQIS